MLKAALKRPSIIRDVEVQHQQLGVIRLKAPGLLQRLVRAAVFADEDFVGQPRGP